MVAVATENRIRAGADAAMGYPRFGMIDLLKLLHKWTFYFLMAVGFWNFTGAGVFGFLMAPSS